LSTCRCEVLITKSRYVCELLLNSRHSSITGNNVQSAWNISRHCCITMRSWFINCVA